MSVSGRLGRCTIHLTPVKLGWLLSLLLIFNQCTPTKPGQQQRQPLQAETTATFVLPAVFPREEALAPALQELAANRADANHWRAVGILYQRLSPPDRMDYVHAAAEHLEQADALAPQHPLTNFYLGLTNAALGRDTTKPPLVRLQKAQKGFRLLDQVVNTLPDNPSFRILRTRISLFAPGLLARQAAIDEDIAWLTRHLAQQPPWPDHVVAAANLAIGDYHQLKTKDVVQAKSYWQLAKQWGKGSAYAEFAGNRLQGQPPSYE